MKRKMIFTAMAVAMGMLATVAAHAEDKPADGMGGGMMKPQVGGGAPGGAPDPALEVAHKADEAMRFKHMKEEMTLHLNNKMEEIRSKQSCVAAAADMKGLMKCGPMMMGGGMMHGGGMMMGGPGGMRKQGGGQQGMMMGGPGDAGKGGMMQGGQPPEGSAPPADPQGGN